jgi:hypothetical protein
MLSLLLFGGERREFLDAPGELLRSGGITVEAQLVARVDERL